MTSFEAVATVLGLEDVHDLLEIMAVNAHNKAVVRQNAERR